jgi:ABC-2 type transport system permease protein
LLVFAVSMGLAAGAVLGDVPAQLGALVAAGLVQLPGIMVVGGAVVALSAALAVAGLVAFRRRNLALAA